MAISVKIYPPIGIARLGNSPSEYFIGPEMVGDSTPPAGGYRDAQGRVKRQAARFHLYAWDDGVFLGEITNAVADISWTVELANVKGDWFSFVGIAQLETPLRNATVTDRATLRITPGSRTLNGPNQSAAFDSGFFMGYSVPLGNIQTDADGRLLVLGGFGYSDSPTSAPIRTFANNDFWFDDVSDGPVTATVTLKGTNTPLQVAGAWVICPPPRFAPPVYHIITLYDTLLQVAVDKLGVQPPPVPSFTNDIWPILNHAVEIKWVSNKAGNHHEPLTDTIPPPMSAQLREYIFNHLRPPNTPPKQGTPHAMPAIWSDYFPFVPFSAGWVSQPLTPTQYEFMLKWKNGNFINDWVGFPQPGTLITPEGLTRAALQNCIGGPFVPGIETSYLTPYHYPYIEPFRVDGAQLHAGDLTKQNAIPWQADFTDCAYEAPLSWWPAAHPDDVYPEAGGPQVPWARGINSYYEMVEKWWQLGFLVRRGHDIVETERLLP